MARAPGHGAAGVSMRGVLAPLGMFGILQMVPIAPGGAQTLRLVPVQPLSFGQLAPRQARVIAPISVSAAVFTIQGPANATVIVTTTLPTLLANPTGGSLQIGSWTATVATGASGTPTNATPVNNGDLAITLDAGGIGLLRIGASVQPTLATPSGTFTASIGLMAREPVSGRLSLTAQAPVMASVLQPITISAIPMYFPAVYTGTPATIAPDDVRALRLVLDGAAASSVDVTFESLPAALSNEAGSASLSIGTWRQRTGADCSGAATAPLTGTTVSLPLAQAIGAGARTAICLGATVTPTAVQPGGLYTGTVTISVRYTGS